MSAGGPAGARAGGRAGYSGGLSPVSQREAPILVCTAPRSDAPHIQLVVQRKAYLSVERERERSSYTGTVLASLAWLLTASMATTVCTGEKAGSRLQAGGYTPATEIMPEIRRAARPVLIPRHVRPLAHAQLLVKSDQPA